MVKLYLKAGAIPLVRGNVPQTCMMLHTKNLIFGEARNPLRQDRSCGGSSGGEAGLVVSRCVPFGLGTDIGGSVRFPSAFCGIYGIKPTSSRVTMYGVPPARIDRSPYSCPAPLSACIGPIGFSVDDLIVNC